MLGLPYPGGPALAQLAASGRPGRYSFPRPMLDRPGFEFSFSGLKTAVMQAVRSAVLSDQERADVALAVQDAIVSTLCAKALRALEYTGHGALVVARAVSVPISELRARLTREARAAGAQVYFPRLEFCTDNAAMIAVAGLHRLRAHEQTLGGIEVPGPAGRCRSCGRSSIGLMAHSIDCIMPHRVRATWQSSDSSSAPGGECSR